jgi:hypothetical protein
MYVPCAGARPRRLGAKLMWMHLCAGARPWLLCDFRSTSCSHEKTSFTESEVNQCGRAYVPALAYGSYMTFGLPRAVARKRGLPKRS